MDERHITRRPPSTAGVWFAGFLALHAIAHFAGVTRTLQQVEDGSSAEYLGGWWTISSSGALRTMAVLWTVLGVATLVGAIAVAIGSSRALSIVQTAAAGSLVMSVVASWAAVIGVVLNVVVLAIVARRSASLFVADGPTPIVIDEAAARRFLDLRRIALVGASADPHKFSHSVLREMLGHQIDVVPINPAARVVAGVRSYPDLSAVPDEIDGVLVMVTGDAAVATVHEAADIGARHVWLFRGAGSGGALSEASLAACRAHDLDVVAGACPLMFLDPVAVVHRVHRFVRHTDGTLTDAA